MIRPFIYPKEARDILGGIAMGDNPDGSEKVHAASSEEIKNFEQSRQHLPAMV
jgi:hypothetical protein